MDIEDSYRKASALRVIAQALAQAKEPDRALLILEAIEDREYRADAQSEIAQILAQAGQYNLALKTLQSALIIASQLGRSNVFTVLRKGAATLARPKKGKKKNTPRYVLCPGR